MLSNNAKTIQGPGGGTHVLRDAESRDKTFKLYKTLGAQHNDKNKETIRSVHKPPNY